MKKSKNCFFLGKQADFYLNILLNIIRHWRGANEEGDICKFSVNLLSDISYLQERKSAKARAQSAKIKNRRNQAKKMPRAQERKGAIGVRAEVAAKVTTEVVAEKNLALCPKMCYNSN